jgi:hypothetical protein
MSIALLVRIEALERRLAALEAEMVRLKSAPTTDKIVEKPAPAKKKAP